MRKHDGILNTQLRFNACPDAARQPTWAPIILTGINKTKYECGLVNGLLICHACGDVDEWQVTCKTLGTPPL